jgi:hypothetical protein
MHSNSTRNLFYSQKQPTEAVDSSQAQNDYRLRLFCNRKRHKLAVEIL